MKTREMMTGSENLSWCKPYIGSRVAYTLCEGYITCIRIDGEDFTAPAGERSVSSEILHRAAMIAVPDYDLYNGWTDEELLLTESDCKECGCCDCPFFDVCDAMDEELEGETMNAEMMTIMVENWLADNNYQDGGEYDDLVIDWDSARYDDELGCWCMSCRDDDHDYTLTANDGMISINS